MSAVSVRETSDYPQGTQKELPRFRVHSDAVDVSLVLFTGKGAIRRAVVTNTTGTAGYLQVHDALTLPVDTTVPVFSIQLPASGSAVIEDLHCAIGAVLAISTTAGTLTISTNDAFFSANVTK
jgi:hypothetical protein